MDTGDTYSPGYTGDQSDTALDAIVAAAEDRLLAAVCASLDLETGLARIIGNPPRPQTEWERGIGGVESKIAGAAPEECSPGIKASPCTSSAETPAGGIRAGSAESRYLTGPGKPLSSRAGTMRAREAAAAARAQAARIAVEHAENADEERRSRHQGSGSGLIRLLIPAVILAEAVMIYMAMQFMIRAQVLAAVLAVLAALAGVGLAWTIAGRRLTHPSLRGAVRILEGFFVAAVTALRYESVRVQQHASRTAPVAAALTAISTALALGAVEVIAAETRTFGTFLGTMRVSWKRWRYSAATTRLARARKKGGTVTAQLQQDFLNFLLKTEGLPFGLAQLRSAALIETSVANQNDLNLDEKPITGPGFFPRPDPGRHRGRRTVVLAAVAAAAGATTVVTTGFLIARPADNSPPQQPTAYSSHAPTSGSVTNKLSPPPGALPVEVVVFMHGQAQLSNSAKADLNSWLNEIKDLRATPITIRGYGDPGREASANYELSLARAQGVAAFLKGQGVPASQLAVSACASALSVGASALASNMESLVGGMESPAGGGEFGASVVVSGPGS